MMVKASLCPIALLLLGLPFLASAQDVPVMKDVDVTKLAGKWYPVRAIKSEPDPIELHVFTLEAAADGGIKLNFEIPKDGACTLKTLNGNKDSPGVFSSSDGKATVMDTDYNTYLFVYLSNDKVSLLELYGRNKKVSKDVKKKFKALGKKVGIKPAHRFKLRKEDMCTSPPA